jgi:DNA-binding CsgD family transcriptional regulator
MEVSLCIEIFYYGERKFLKIKRQKKVKEPVATGMKKAEIARKMGVTPVTVDRDLR